MELTILMPCLNEAKTVASCVTQARKFLLEQGIKGEVLVADNGSVDGSPELAAAVGARVVSVQRKGYGSALRAGIQAAKGRFIIMGDADESYDFSRLQGFLDKLRAGIDLVMGDRFAGGIQSGAMPLLHRYLGNPVLSYIGRLFFHLNVRDFHCGLRGFRRDSILKLRLRSSGMEFASEMVVKAALAKLSISQVPTTLAPDGRDRAPHLRTWRDGWRHLRFLLMLSPRWLFLYPGSLMTVLGVAGLILLCQGQLHIGSIVLGIHTMLFAAAGTMLGVQMVGLGVAARLIGHASGVMPMGAGLARVVSFFSLERGVLAGLIFLLAGLYGTVKAFAVWSGAGFGPIEVGHLLRDVVLSVTCLLLGAQVVVISFLITAVDSLQNFSDE